MFSDYCDTILRSFVQGMPGVVGLLWVHELLLQGNAAVHGPVVVAERVPRHHVSHARVACGALPRGRCLKLGTSAHDANGRAKLVVLSGGRLAEAGNLLRLF
mmetsp:Transcript_20441/g.27616  ORF Transcript_20441/g.27616 Transcript_20441/m.27616 type:complete len:102 (+) Transcript_20441:1950-2255(+)